ncbi:MAG TPA: hypothetical protein VJL28_14405 [Gemmatimonadaceae bacterium]|nr:hypothetical protein [Gemmatimonadaceae bacterium]
MSARAPRSSTAGSKTRRADAPPKKHTFTIDCYCGLGPSCHLWRQMTPEQRELCTRDKRYVAQSFWKNGVVR